MSTKKRELLSTLGECIILLSNLSGPAAKLELYDQDEASKHVKNELIRLKKGPLERLAKDIQEVRNILNDGHKRRKLNKITNNIKNQES